MRNNEGIRKIYIFAILFEKVLKKKTNKNHSLKHLTFL